MLIKKIINRLRKTDAVANEPRSLLKLVYRLMHIVGELRKELEISISAFGLIEAFKKNIHLLADFAGKSFAQRQSGFKTGASTQNEKSSAFEHVFLLRTARVGEKAARQLRGILVSATKSRSVSLSAASAATLNGKHAN
jgi:hypothetical protein